MSDQLAAGLVLGAAAAVAAGAGFRWLAIAALAAALPFLAAGIGFTLGGIRAWRHRHAGPAR